MEEKNNCGNVFKFSLFQGKILLGEKILDADLFNPITRYSIDIRPILPKIINKFQRVLSKKSYDTIILDQIDLLGYHNDMNRTIYNNELKYNPESITQKIEDKVIKGVECKIGFYINDNPIVERVFYVDGFNPVSRWSVDVIDTLNIVVDEIFENIKTSDVKNMWDDYDLINKRGFTINQIREFSHSRRNELLNSLNKY